MSWRQKVKKKKTELKVVFRIEEDCFGRLYLYEKDYYPENFFLKLICKLFFIKPRYLYIYESYKMEDISKKIEETLNYIRKSEFRTTLTFDTYIVNKSGYKLISQEDN